MHCQQPQSILHQVHVFCVSQQHSKQQVTLSVQPGLSVLILQVMTAQASHTRHLSEAAQLRQELRQLSTRLQIAESDQQHLEATCKQVTATAEAEWAVKVESHCTEKAFAFKQLGCLRFVAGPKRWCALNICVAVGPVSSMVFVLQGLAVHAKGQFNIAELLKESVLPP